MEASTRGMLSQRVVNVGFPEVILDLRLEVGEISLAKGESFQEEDSVY